MARDEEFNGPHNDDSPRHAQASQRAHLAGAISELGENLIKANSGREAREHLLKTDTAIVLMDVSMLEINGFELVEIIGRLATDS